MPAPRRGVRLPGGMPVLGQYGEKGAHPVPNQRECIPRTEIPPAHQIAAVPGRVAGRGTGTTGRPVVASSMYSTVRTIRGMIDPAPAGCVPFLKGLFSDMGKHAGLREMADPSGMVIIVWVRNTIRTSSGRTPTSGRIRSARLFRYPHPPQSSRLRSETGSSCRRRCG